MAARPIFYSKDDQDSLFKRYLFWLYKMTKDELDKIERKFTQLELDRQIQKALKKKHRLLEKPLKKKVDSFLQEWGEYIAQKEADAQKLKFSEDGGLRPKYLFLHMKLEAILQLTESYFGRKGVMEFKRLYHDAAMNRIKEDVSGRR